MTSVPSHAHNGPSTPAHLALIMDGNGRWAKSRGLPRIEGHRRGADSVRTAISCCIKYGVRYLTLYSFSSENWKRPAQEVDDLMGLLRRYLQSEIAELHKNGVRLRVIGDRTALGRDIISLIEDAEALTRANQTLDLIVALSYGGRAEIANAARRVAEDVAAGRIAIEDIGEEAVAAHLDTVDIPDPDIMVRTSGEQRISNFLLWQMAYTEFVFLDTLWPDFSEKDFVQVISEFQRRERRFGGT
jgi:undecaprenyl diphosphate synthase